MLYKIRNWNEIYEINRTRDMKVMQWIPLPIKLSGAGYSYLMTLKNGAALFGCFIAILELAGRSEVRGELLRGAGNPHSIGSIARQIRMDETLVMNTIDHCSSADCDWIVIENQDVIIEGAERVRDSRKKVRDTCATENTEITNKTEKRVFTIPTIQQISDYCKERKNTVIPQKFFDHYESNGWLVGKNKMKNWQAAVRKWENSSYNNSYKEDEQRKFNRPEPKKVSEVLPISSEPLASAEDAQKVVSDLKAKMGWM